MDVLSLPAGGSVAATTTTSPLGLFPTNPVLVATKLAVSFSNKFAARRAVVVRTAISVRASFPSQAEATASGSLWPSTPRTRWMVVMERPPGGGSSKPDVIDYYVETLASVLGSEKEAQMCIYDASWRSQYGFCCDIDEESSRELARNDPDLSETNEVQKIRTKRLFVTGLSFYTSEKTLRAAFEGFVKIIMDKISKRSKGYAFIEYTTEEAASAALKEMNGKIINGWMIVVDVARTNPPKYSRGYPWPSSSSISSK
ncbi:hypothetical protein MUK42_26614 [Musa troglodytarum]|uniref:RRM domain-containing protein n=1 Tax=Musa troglodytarum TaxID=320322 RepID=A0A9E7JP27_9LILI|nr:hypothetical protein MUK42_26614 [Musa troglodytarum]